MKRIVQLCAAAILAASSITTTATTTADDNWCQWGGEDRDFRVNTDRSLDQLQLRENWRRPLGEGYSAILVEGERLYTMYRRGDDEYVVCLRADSGETVWEIHYAAPMSEDATTEFGKGPNSTPIIVDDRLVTVGFNGDLHCLDKSSGEVIWETNLITDEDGTLVDLGYSASPIHYDGNIILPIGGEGQAIVAFRVSDGSRAWSAQDFKNSYSTPLITTVDGLDQLILVMTDEVIAINPKNGELFWTFPLVNQWSTHAFVPVWDADNHVLFISSFRQSHALRMTREDDEIRHSTLWSNKNLGIGFTNAVHMGDVVYGTTGGSRTPLVTAIDLRDGRLMWRERGFGVSNYLGLGDRLLLLDEKGMLAVANPTDDGLGIIGKQQVLSAEKVWTVPTMVGNTIYARDQKEIVSLYLE